MWGEQNGSLQRSQPLLASLWTEEGQILLVFSACVLQVTGTIPAEVEYMNQMTLNCVFLFAWWGMGLIALGYLTPCLISTAPVGALFAPGLAPAGRLVAIEAQLPPLVRRA